MAVKISLVFIKLYQILFSSLLGCNCRFLPSCSCYCKEALLKYGFFKGCWLTFKRILRCHPLGGSGFDPVP